MCEPMMFKITGGCLYTDKLSGWGEAGQEKQSESHEPGSKARVLVRAWQLWVKQRACLILPGLSPGSRTPGAFPALSKAQE